MTNLERSKTLQQHFLHAWFAYIAHTFFLFTTQKQYWWGANTEALHQQLLQLITITQELWIIEVKLFISKKIQIFEVIEKKVRWKCKLQKKSMQIVSQQGIKGPDTMGNL